MRYPVLTLRRADLVAAHACAEWLALFDEVCRLRGDDRAPLVRRGGVTRRDPSRLRIELTPLAQLWLSLPPSARAGSAWAWLRYRGAVGAVDLTDADLSGADLTRADLSGAVLRVADLRGADLTRADLMGADLARANLVVADLRGAYLAGANLMGADLARAILTGADLRGADLRGAYLAGANLMGADLSGACRWITDPPVPGWTLRDGRLVREVR